MNIRVLSIILLHCAVPIRAMDNSMSPTGRVGKLLSHEGLSQSMSPSSCSEANSGVAGASLGMFQLDSPVLKKETILEISSEKIGKSVPQTPLGLVTRGVEYYEGDEEKAPDYTAAFLCFDKVLQQVNPKEPMTLELGKAVAKAHLYRGQMFYLGLGVTQNDNAAHDHWKRAARQECDGAVFCKAALWLSKLYYKWQKFTYSASCLEKVINNKNNDPVSGAEAHLLLGMQHEEGEGVTQSLALAECQYKLAENQSVNPSILFAAKFCLCHLVYAGKAVLPGDQDKSKNKIALNYCDTIIANAKELYPDYVAKARLRRGILYAEGGYGIKKDLKRAQEDLNYVLNQKDDHAAAAQAKKKLDQFNLSVTDLICLDEKL
jgi:TPR repeat protein